ncbi:hypothetical protein [Aliarcobacter butzleri]|uniref:TnsE C-terminal domain-containing protein n=1 Tax=Aliarcobacter butzleri L348 TaxID=1447256 RepID=A0A0G9K1E8_9BACT|nr:hypothetical protein [Aliarcobacter butzleri]KLE00327.1 hypothetical protein AA20_05745 [Aliarcobacter butzleri L348]
MTIKCFNNYPDKKFKLVAVNDINYIYPHRYSVTFQDIESLEKYEEFLLPEQLRGKYIIGNIYSINGLEKENQSKLNNLYIPKRKVTHKNSFRIKDCINLEDYGLSDEDRFYEQNCFIYETKKFIFMIPNHVVANRYYFISTSIKKALSKGSFESLYYKEKGYKLIDDTLYITIKNTLRPEQVPLIARMISDETSEKNFLFFFQQISKHKISNPNYKDIFKPVFLGFPFKNNEDFNIKCNILYLNNVYSYDKFKSYDLRKVIMITHIFEDTIPYNFKNLKLKRFQEINTDNGKKNNETENRTINKDTHSPSGKTTTVKPTSTNLPSREIFNVNNNYNFSKINIDEKIIETETKISYNTTEDEADTSFDDLPEDIDKNVIEKLLDDDLKKDCFKIENFYDLINSFINEYQINNYSISDIIDLENHEESKINKFYIDSEKEIPRKLIYGYLSYKNFIVNFIEVEHNTYWNKSTWYFISNNIFSESKIHSILNLYIINNQSIKQMIEDNKLE